jgi:predicted transposase YbfD/YdcC
VEKSCALVEQLKTIPDPRRPGQNLKHRLEDVLLLGFCGTLAGCDDFVEIAPWASLHQEFFRTFLELENGIPSQDTFNRVFALIPPSTLQAVLLPWLQRQRGLAGDWIPIDGKTRRGTRKGSAGRGALHLVSAWATEAGLTLGPVAVEEKSNEITAIPQLLELLDLQEKIVTIDAIGCQKEIAEAIVQGGGDYVLAVKDNQPTLHQQIQAAFQTASTKEIRTSITQEKGHGRQECREVHVFAVSAKDPSRDSWKGLKSWVMVVRMVT